MANKKINQLVSKTAILSTDIFGIGDATTGQLFKKTIAELQAAIGGAVISVNGLVGTVVLNTDNIQETATPTNKYYTDARARGAISLTVAGSSGASTYNSGTGVLNVPTYSLAGLGGITAAFLSGTSGISYNSTTGVISFLGTVYTDASIRALFSGGTGITYNSSTGAISYSGTVYTDASIRALLSAGTGISYNSTTGAIASTITQYTDALARASISLTVTGNSGASTYTGSTGVLNIPTYTLSGLGGQPLATNLTSLSGLSYVSVSFVKMSAAGTFSLDTSVYLTSITSGNVTTALGFTPYNATNPSGYTSNVGTVTSVAALTLGTTGTDISSSVATGTVTPVITLNVPNASASNRGALIAADWSTFNSKQATVTLTTTGTSGVATFSANTLNIPNYGSALSGYLPLIGGTLTGALTGTSASFSTSVTNQQTNITADGAGVVLQGYVDNILRIAVRGSGYNSGGRGGLLASTGDFSGALTGTSATFSGAVQSNAYFRQFIATGYYSDFAYNGTTYNLGSSEISDNIEFKIAGGGTFTTGGGFGWFTQSGGVTPVQRMRITSGGNVLINTGTDSGYKFDVNGTGRFSGALTGTSATFSDNNSGGAVGLSVTNTSTGVSASTAVVLKNSGTTTAYIGLGSTARSSYANLGANVLSMYTDNTAGISLSVDAAGIIAFNTNSTERMRITSGGNVLIGTSTDGGYKLYVSGSIYATGTIVSLSDLRAKKNLAIIENPMGKLMKLNGYAYQMKSDDSFHYGVIAQELEGVLPYAVSETNQGVKGVEYNQIIPVLIEAIKEQNVKISNLETILASR